MSPLMERAIGLLGGAQIGLTSQLPYWGNSIGPSWPLPGAAKPRVERSEGSCLFRDPSRLAATNSSLPRCARHLSPEPIEGAQLRVRSIWPTPALPFTLTPPRLRL